MANFTYMNRFSTIFLVSIMSGCTYYENEPIKIPAPDVPDATTTLEASYVTTIPNKISAGYWKTADYLPITAQNQIIGKLPAEDGLYNMSGTFNGLSDFNQGVSPDILISCSVTTALLSIIVP